VVQEEEVKICTVEGCDRKLFAKGMCLRHYMRLRRTGKLTTTRYTGDFWKKVAQGSSTECWPWLGFRKRSGHGLTSMKGRPMHTSRKAWVLTHGPIPSEQQVLHKCDNAICCNPEHMYLGSRIDNMIDLHEGTPFELRHARGRPFVLNDQQLEALWTMRKRGATLKECAQSAGVHIATVCRYITAVRKQKLQALRDKVTRESNNRI